MGFVCEPLETARPADLVQACLAVLMFAPFVEVSTLWLSSAMVDGRERRSGGTRDALVLKATGDT